MEEDINQRYRVAEIPLEGKIVEIGALIPYKSGNGFFRNVLLETAGSNGYPAFVQVTLFGTDATDLDVDLDFQRPLQCTGRLTSRRYLDRNGNVRWALSITAAGVILGHRVSAAPPSAEGKAAEAASPVNGLESDPDDIPF